MNFEAKLEKYAEVIVKVGLNVQEGQRLLITVHDQGVELARAVAKAAYQAGARYVGVIYNDIDIIKFWLQYGSEESLDEVLLDQMDLVGKYGRREDTILSIRGEDPNYLEGFNPIKVKKYQQGRYQNMGAWLDLVQNDAINWCGLMAPSKEYAAKLFPDAPEQEQLEKTWDLVFKMCRADGEDPVADWKAHTDKLAGWKDYLNAKEYTSLKFTGPGTDLTVGLPSGHVWRSAQFVSQAGVTFIANIPTEEVFTLTDRTRVNGIVRATKPLPLGGTFAENFSLTFKDGKVVEVKAEVGEDDLKNIIATDQGAGFTGEVALVPNSSPISQSGHIFYNITYDENASCHIALGNAYRFSLKGGKQMSDEEFAAAGGNVSKLHLDFMLGSGEMDVDGIKQDGSSEALMRAGEWAMDMHP